MNSISWMIYAADVVDKIGGAALAACIFAVIWWWAAIIAAAHHNDLSPRKEDKRPYNMKPLFVAMAIAVAAVFIPSKSTVYMIAASEAGERATQSEIAGDVYQIIKREIKKMKEAK